MVNQSDKISVRRQCGLLQIARSCLYYCNKMESDLNQRLMKSIDKVHMETPCYGRRRMVYAMRSEGFEVGAKRISRLMKIMGIRAIYPKPKTSIPNKDHEKYPYLLRDLPIVRPNQVWCTDITYIPTKHGWMYLVAIMDWYSRKVLSWRLSNTMETDFCIEALHEAMDIYGKPDIFNTDQGSQFTSIDFTGVLKDHGIRISMDGKGCWVDNVFIERLWRSLKYECVYLTEFESGRQARLEIGKWLNFYNTKRYHLTFDGHTPNQVYDGSYKPLTNDNNQANGSDKKVA